MVLVILSLHSKDRLSSHSHLSNSQKSKLGWGALCPTFACHHLENTNIRKLHCHYIRCQSFREAIVLHKKDWYTVASSAADLGQSFRVSTPQFSFNSVFIKSYHVNSLFASKFSDCLNFDQCCCHLGRQTSLCFVS